MPSTFEHLHAAHCESGVTASLFRHRGLELSEPMIFGIGAGLFFVYAPPIKIMEMPLISYRSYPGGIFRKACRRLGVTYRSSRFLSSRAGIRELDELLESGVPVGLRTNIFWLTYFPREFRHQFNGHNLIAVERSGAEYTISDPVLQAPVSCPAAALTRARFARGPLSPRGMLYYPWNVPARPQLRKAVLAGIRDCSSAMLNAPLPWCGVKGIRHLARKIRSWPRTLGGNQEIKLHAGHIIRMQEEVGTGGSGFRYMYAAFLQEAGQRFDHEPFAEASCRMTEVGDAWRIFAVNCGRVIKGRDHGRITCDTLADELVDCAEREREIFVYLGKNLPRRS